MSEIHRIQKKKLKDFKKPVPVNRESPFQYDELFFSITDPDSVITSANSVFVRISRYERDNIMGQLHKLIRHPDMPRSVFYIFWDYLKAGNPVAAYVKNMAKDGSWYWVMALAFPCRGGYFSIRLKPGSPLFTRIKQMYAETLRHEKEQEKRTDKRAAMLSGREHLLSLLKQEGFAGYEDFMWQALQTEMQHRDDILKKSGDADKAEDTATVPGVLVELESLLGRLVRSLENLKQFHKSLTAHSGYILALARNILHLAVNAQIASAKLSDTGKPIAVVSEHMSDHSGLGEKELLRIKNDISQLSELIGILNFDIISSKLQVEMAVDFMRELSSRKENGEDLTEEDNRAVHLLYEAFTPRIRTISKGVGKLPKQFRKLLKGVRQIEQFLIVLRFIHINGNMETARLNGQNNSFSTLFEELIREINAAESHLSELSETVQEQERTGHRFFDIQKELEQAGQKLNSQKSGVFAPAYAGP